MWSEGNIIIQLQTGIFSYCQWTPPAVGDRYFKRLFDKRITKISAKQKRVVLLLKKWKLFIKILSFVTAMESNKKSQDEELESTFLTWF